LCYNFIKGEKAGLLEYVKIDRSKHIIESILEDLYQRKIASLIVEGGTQLFQSFIEMDVWDEIRLFKCEKEFKTGIKHPEFNGTMVSEEYVMGDRLCIYKRI
jgi:diaminohydroxyphosphoribosylaminopyrimidine deaminase/5-amino-6-(5-phosphoribosylamino)uracil reductase